MRTRHLIGTVVLAVVLAACGSAPSNTAQTAAQPMPSSPTKMVGSPPASTTPAAAPARITPRQGEIPYLTSSPNGAYTCWQGMDTVAMIVSDEAGKNVVTTYNRTEFTLKRSDGYYWLSFPRTYMAVMAAIVNDKYGLEMPINVRNGNPDTGNGPDASLYLGDIVGKSLKSFKLCVATPR